MRRHLQPEILDSLPPTDPRAQASRRDLRRLNRLMGNDRWWRRQLAACVRPGARLVEIGAGDGSLHTRVGGPPWDAIDLAPAPVGWPAGARWHRADLTAFPRWAEYDICIGNLIFHHFSDEALGQLGSALTLHTRVILACEPWQHRGYQFLFRSLAPLLGAHAVTRHDGFVSIAAGFRAQELPALLGLRRDRWHWRV